MGEEIFLKKMPPELVKSNFLQNIHIDLISEFKGEKNYANWGG